MKKFCLLAVLFTLIASYASCQTYEELDGRNQSRNIGSAKKLKGRVLVVCFFSKEPGTEFTKEEQDEYMRDLKIAENWMINEGRKYNANLSFTNVSYGYGNPYVHSFEPDEYPGAAKIAGTMINKTLPQMQSLYSKWKTGDVITGTYYEPFDAVITVILSNTKVLQSWASTSDYNYETYEFFDEYPEGVVITGRTNYRATTMTHELLHLFGTWDLYCTDKFFGGWRYYYDQFAYSVMNHTYYTLDQLNIDEINLYLIGWTNEYKPWYRYFGTYND